VALNKHESCNLSVSFRPSSGGSRTGSITISDNSPQGTHQIALTGTGVQLISQATVAPSLLQFGNVTLQTQSASQTLTLSNIGGAPLTINNIATTGDFAQMTTCGPSVLAGSNCTIQVTAKPSSVGICTGTVSITDNAPGSQTLWH
jgi:hypothetical protein